MQCYADYGDGIGPYYCPADRPSCDGFVHNVRWGTCIELTPAPGDQCYADYGAGEGQFFCPVDRPKCCGFVHDVRWGTCTAKTMGRSAPCRPTSAVRLESW
eukprot:5689168-Prymnesium_polylepis.1